ncbi:MAG: S41 family peptidase [Bacteroidota bacterium]|nr:S41 family peptidase [Bacteroidota bacterium]
MKTILVSLCFLMFSYIGIAQTISWQWPVKGSQPGENILFKPQAYIDKELNFGQLFIGGHEGDEVIAPVDGVITFFGYKYYKTLKHSVSCGINTLNDKEDRAAFANRNSESIDPKYVSVCVGIKTISGKVIYVEGLRPERFFKTGEKITKGEVIGSVGYVYYKIHEPAISISISENGKTVDPMSAFGLKTSFINPKAHKQKEVLSVEEMGMDFKIFVEALKEGHPGLYDYISITDFEILVKNTLSLIEQPMSFTDFTHLLIRIISRVRDSHLSYLPTRNATPTAKETFIPTINFGWLKDSLVVNRTIENDKNYLARKVLEVDGIVADSLKRFLSLYQTKSDGYIESYPDFELLTLFVLRYFYYHPKASKKGDLSLTFANGETVRFRGEKMNGRSCINLQPKWRKYYLANKIKTANFKLEKLSNQTAYIGLGTFDLNEVETEKIVGFVKNISDSSYEHLIIDVRNNYGGDKKNVKKLFALIAQQSFSQQVLCKVKNKEGYQFFNNCLNYGPESYDIFPNYYAVKGKEGLYYIPDSSGIQPDTVNNFKGKVYVLTNERSFSASAVFAALVHKYKRGVIVGRETGSTYYHINGDKFADLSLPNSGIVIQIPLVQVVFDTINDSSIPWGRGVIPDYPVDFTLSELAWESGDFILNYTKSLIEQSKCFLDERMNRTKKCE